jgi:hypothetical protein
MVEMSVDTIMELDQNEFNQLVNDEWNWKSGFTSSIYSNSGYSGTSGISGTCGSSGTSGVAATYYIPITFDEDED